MDLDKLVLVQQFPNPVEGLKRRIRSNGLLLFLKDSSGRGCLG